MVIFISFIKKQIRQRRRTKFYQRYANQFKAYLQMNRMPNSAVTGEEAYLEKWQVFGDPVEPYSYRFFSHFCGNTPNIVPEDIGHVHLETALNPLKYRSAYEDKNLFPEIVGAEHVPATVLCRINGSRLLNADYQLAQGEVLQNNPTINRLVLKPSVDSCSGNGVMVFSRKNNDFYDVGGVKLDEGFLMKYGNDFVLQEAVEQHPFMSHLCKSSVNTIRICTYRSPVTEQSHVTAAIVRIGKEGAIVDNAHSGGMFVGVDVNSGRLADSVLNQYGKRYSHWNNIDLKQESLVIPDWPRVVDFAKLISKRVHHHRLLALDIAIRHDGTPVLLEYNISQFSYWLFMMTNQQVFGEYTDEVIEYCLKNPAPKMF